MSLQPQPKPEGNRKPERRKFIDSLSRKYINVFIENLIDCYVQLGLGLGLEGIKQAIITNLAQSYEDYNLLKDFSLLLNLHNIFKIIFKIKKIDTPKVVREFSLEFNIEEFKNKTYEEILREIKISILKLVLFAVFFYFHSKNIQLNQGKSAGIFNFFTSFKYLISKLSNRNFWTPTDSFKILNQVFSINNILDLIEKAIISIRLRSWFYYFLEFYRSVIKGEHSLDLGEVIKDFYGNENFVILLSFLLLPEGNEIVIYSPSKSLTIKPENFEVTQNYLEVNLEDIKKAVLELTKWLIFEQEWRIDPNKTTKTQLDSIKQKLLALLNGVEGITSTNELQRKIEIPDISIQIFINNLKNLGLEIAQQKIRRPISLFYIKQLLEKPII